MSFVVNKKILNLKRRLKVVQKRFYVNKQNQNKKYERKQILLKNKCEK